MSNLFTLLSKEDHLAGPRRREQGSLMDQQVGELVSPSSVKPVVNYDTIKEIARVRLEKTLHYQASQIEPVQPIR